MRMLRRNLVPFYYQNYCGKVPILDDDGYETGEYVASYSEPTKCFGNISVPSGRASVETFGTEVDYDKVIMLAGTSPVDENSRLYVDRVPGDGVEPDYIVKRVAESLNFTSIAIRRVRT